MNCNPWCWLFWHSWRDRALAGPRWIARQWYLLRHPGILRFLKHDAELRAGLAMADDDGADWIPKSRGRANTRARLAALDDWTPDDGERPS